MIELISYGFAAAAVATLLCLLLLRRTVFNILDPLIVIHFFIPFIAAELVVLCATGLVPWDKFWWFWMTLVAYLVGARFAGAFFGRETFRQLLEDALDRVRRSEIHAILFVTAGVTLVLAAFAVIYGAQGDMRQGFARIFRPLVVLQGGLFLLSLVLLLSRKLSMSAVVAWMVLIVVPSIAFSGKSVLIPVLYWVGLRLYLNRKTVTLRAGAAMLAVVFLGVSVMGVLAYGASSVSGLVRLFIFRLWRSGETYIYAYQWDAMASLRGHYDVAFIPYVLHPITSLVGVRAYEKPLGAMLFSQVFGDDIVGGPNPLLPIVLDYFFPNAWVVAAVVAFLTGLLVLGIRSAGMVLARSRSRYVRLGGITAAIFSPAMGFSDTSLVLIALIGVVAATVFGVAVELLFAGRGPTKAIASAGSAASHS
jgi:hypothetical protein